MDQQAPGGDGLLERFQLLHPRQDSGQGPVWIGKACRSQIIEQESRHQAGEKEEHDSYRGVLAEA